ncbi:transformer-2 protein homolog alpha-like isoform X2 [Paramacrobiotus metropolitanus]|nr:transformer-2 protein homolog alpha-like isoform X2 [Paramacrobiotus metropolitanus]XP_055341674.1 transformer-2 protein homolog alpha-like isoform X2 [Paramacrobiotus metropolitanus]
MGSGDQEVDQIIDESTNNGDERHEHDNGRLVRNQTSSPSGRSESVGSARSENDSRRRVDVDIKKGNPREESPKRRRRKDSPVRKSRSHTPSPSPRKGKRTRSDDSPRRSRSGSRHRDRDRNGRSEKRRRSRSPRRRSPVRRSRSPPPRPRYGRYSERDNPKPSKCIGVFGLSTRTREKDLRDEFDKYGLLDNVQLIHDHKTGRSRGFGFVYFAHLEDAKAARDGANGMVLDDRRIRVDFSLTQRNRSPPPRSPRRSRSRSRSPRRRRSRS